MLTRAAYATNNSINELKWNFLISGLSQVQSINLSVYAYVALSSAYDDWRSFEKNILNYPNNVYI